MIDEKRFMKSVAKETVHNIIMENRRKISVSGVEDVDSFDEESVSLYTQGGLLIIKGEGLHINKLSLESGDVTVEGEITSLVYSDETKEKNTSFFGKLFR